MNWLKENWFRVAMMAISLVGLMQLIEIRDQLHYLNYTTFNKLMDIKEALH